MTRHPLMFPFGGRADAAAHSDQPGLFTRAAQNVRGRDPISGRVRGARRSGLSKWNANALGAGRVRALCSTALDDRKLTYSFTSGAVTTDWAATTPSKQAVKAGRVDRQGNVYALDGAAGIVKFNSGGREIQKIALPVADAAHVVRALWVDNSDRIFAGVSEGGDVRTARIFCVLQLPENEYQVLWHIEPGAYCEELRLFRGVELYAALNYTREVRSRVLVYDNLGLDPAEARRIESVAHPIHGMDVREDGSVYCASGAVPRPSGLGLASTRLGPGTAFTPPLVGWKPTDDTTLKVWSWFDAEEIDTTDVAGAALVDGAQVLRWRDKSGNGRDLYSGALLVADETGPLYQVNGIGGKPCVRFNTGATTTTKHSLVSYGNGSIEKSLADQQRSMIPSYTDAMWALFMVIRPSPDSDATTPSPRTLLAIKNEAGGGASDHVLFMNRQDAAAPLPGAVTSGFASYYAVTAAVDGGQGAGGLQSLDFQWTSVGNSLHGTGCVIVSILWDGGVNGGDTSKTRCLVRYNGQPIDRFEGLPFKSVQPTWIGAAPTTIFATGMDVARRFKGEIAEMLVIDRRDRNDNTTEPKVLTYDALETGSPNVAQTDNQVTRIEGYLAYKWGIGHVLPNESVHLYRHPYGSPGVASALRGPPQATVGGFFETHKVLLMPDGLVSKHDAQGVLRWAVSTLNGKAVDTAAQKGGYGWGVRARKIDDVVHVWCAGPGDGTTTGTGHVAVRKIIDKDSATATFSVASADGAWVHAFALNEELTYQHPRLEADAFGNLFVPGNAPANIHGLTIFAKDGIAGAGVVRHTETLPSASDDAYAVALPPDSLNPDYRSDIPDKIAEVCYVFTEPAVAGDEDAVYKLRLVQSATVASGSAASVVTVGVSGSDVRVVTESTNVIATGGSGVVDAGAQYVQCLRAGDDIVIVDGKSVLAYKLRDGEVETLKPTSAGEVPQRPKLAMFWRHRLVLGNLADAPGQYVASRLGNIRDWDLRIVNPTATQAFAGSATRAGEAEDAITAMIPVWDDLAFIGCNSRILRITGDPQDGGNIHKVTDSQGIAFGDAWCKDAQGRVFVFGTNPPGLYQLVVDGDPVPLSRHTLEESEFAGIDFNTHRIVLAWNPIDRGVHIFRVAWGAASQNVTHWFWEEKTHRLVSFGPLWTDRFFTTLKQPSALTFLGGDDSRHLLLGGEDGYIRKWDPAARGDDGDPIDSFALLAASPKTIEGYTHRMREAVVVLAGDQEGCRMELFASDTADDIGTAIQAVTLAPGRNALRRRVAGAYLWLRLRAAGFGPWAFEEGSVDLVPSGRVRQRPD